MKIHLTENEIMQLLKIALESDASPIQLPNGTKIKPVEIVVIEEGSVEAVLDLVDAEGEQAPSRTEHQEKPPRQARSSGTISALCIVCGVKFEAKRQTAKYCSKRCANASFTGRADKISD